MIAFCVLPVAATAGVHFPLDAIAVGELTAFDVVEEAIVASASSSLLGFDVVEVAEPGARPADVAAASGNKELAGFDALEEAEAPGWGHLQFLKYLWKKGKKVSRHLDDK